MPYSHNIHSYPDSVLNIMNHAVLYGSVDIPCLDRSPYSLRQYFHSYRQALKKAAENPAFDKSERLAYQALFERFSPLVFQIEKGPPPALHISQRNSTDLGRFLAKTARDLAAEDRLRGTDRRGIEQIENERRLQASPKEAEELLEDDMEKLIKALSQEKRQ